jgi:hypothetical protein
MTWVIAGHGRDLQAGPEHAVGAEPRARISMVDPISELGPIMWTVEVAESGVRTFTVPWHLVGNRTVAAHPIGGNQVSWPSAPEAFPEFGITAADRVDVHVRFVLRHLTTWLLAEDLGGRSIHAVTAALPAGGVLAVAGATRSGKTRLIDHLAAAGLVGAIIDDDCPIIAANGSLATLIPRYEETVTAVHETLSAIILLAPDATGVREVGGERAMSLLTETPVPWPAPWLPTPARLELPALPDIPMIEVQAQDESAFGAVTQWVRATL